MFPPCAAVAGETIVSLDGSEDLCSLDRGEGEGSVPELEQEGYRLGSKDSRLGYRSPQGFPLLTQDFFLAAGGGHCPANEPQGEV